MSLGRVQNFKNWSPHSVPDQSRTALGLEYFANVGNELWEMRDEELIALGTREIEKIGLASAHDVVDATVVRMPKAYPVYDDYKQNVAIVRDRLEANLKNLQLVGRNGIHNQDHSMRTALLAARNILREDEGRWNVNTHAEYHEKVREDHDRAGRMTPHHLSA